MSDDVQLEEPDDAPSAAEVATRRTEPPTLDKRAEPNRPDLMEGGKYCLSPLWFLFQHLFGGLSALWCLHKKLLSYSLSDENKLFVTLRFFSRIASLRALSKGSLILLPD